MWFLSFVNVFEFQSKNSESFLKSVKQKYDVIRYVFWKDIIQKMGWDNI